MTRKLNITQKNKVQLHFYSYKNHALMYVDSNLEQDLARVFEFDDNIKRYRTQPFSTYYRNELGDLCRYTEDVLIEYVDTSLNHLEIKPEKHAKTVVFKHKLDILKRHYKSKFNAQLNVFTDKTFTKEHIQNCKLLYRFKVKPLSLLERGFVQTIDIPSLTFGQLKERVLAANQHLSLAFKIAAHQALKWNIKAALNDETTMEVCA
ncbi:TnsA endonuclease N-terminal domain-containing protein [Paraglaciecola hydrolytica]|uniref:TnsA endonuclease N-terminal domain-containing protein n=1 Tax=Paraglaciecola hydrolytica TaxID=1799789 RepID=A0A136A2X2_9ALTE|nr:TnsA endonuclease N-terminal domain-containing protein [Paraglaciecola hydrolytica]KXI29599.1 hypothetical protein AX660_05970 [Paraglaciecola hydrolytica]